MQLCGRQLSVTDFRRSYTIHGRRGGIDKAALSRDLLHTERTADTYYDVAPSSNPSSVRKYRPIIHVLHFNLLLFIIFNYFYWMNENYTFSRLLMNKRDSLPNCYLLFCGTVIITELLLLHACTGHVGLHDVLTDNNIIHAYRPTCIVCKIYM